VLQVFKEAQICPNGGFIAFMTMNCNFGIQVFSITGVTVDTQSKGGEPLGPACRFV
jgi:hypothetical protein